MALLWIIWALVVGVSLAFATWCLIDTHRINKETARFRREMLSRFENGRRP